MKQRSKNKGNEAYLKALGHHIERVIEKKGYKSPYDFWVNKAGDDLSRAALNYIVAGQSDIKILTIKTLARLLNVKPRDLLDFAE